MIFIYKLYFNIKDYDRNNKCYIIIIYFGGGGHKLYTRGRQIFKYESVYIDGALLMARTIMHIFRRAD
jgi:hypothetical protein